MDRAEVVAALREAYEKGGMRLLAAIADDIRIHGPLHDPEWVLCLDCGNEFERPQSAVINNPTAPTRCPTCVDAVKAERQIRRNERRRIPR